MVETSDAGARAPGRASLGALRPLLPYGFAYRGRIAGALMALIVASGATLVVPFAVRQMIDHGFSEQQSGLIRVYFLAMIGVVAVLAAGSGLRYYFVMT